jgi:hypothetical protein
VLATGCGIQTIPIERIVGSEERADDFDRDFRPLQSHTRRQWQSLARARLEGIPLPPVTLIRINDAYYVRDGHHRISVACAFGQTYVEAMVTEYMLTSRTTVAESGSATAEPQPCLMQPALGVAS